MIPCICIVGSLTYAQVCTRPDITYAVSILSRFQSNPGQEYWKSAKKVMRYLKKTGGYMLSFQYSHHLEILGTTKSTRRIYLRDKWLEKIKIKPSRIQIQKGAEIESNVGEKMLGNVCNEHKILIPTADLLSLSQQQCTLASHLQQPIPEDEANKMMFNSW
ncbi:uncharacterized protein LOC111411121 [Olea europaea var. sylvestris]|uniref:uncharacterized protein LOC111411121 n=1 Tax=Olea europaea var. sylvestris TaxID=158386 RepID=UPI000C1CFB6F|nr:uncharacterized protein LOC111411121 [Olea europaea var. sylvestris]